MNVLERYVRFYGSFKGRLNRKNYFLYILETIGLVILCVPSFIVTAILTSNNISSIFMVVVMFLIAVIAIIGVIGIVSVIVTMSVVVKRLHDLNYSGWWILLFFFPLDFDMSFIETMTIQLSLPLAIIVKLIAVVVYYVFLIVLLFVKGTKGENKYGSDLLQMNNINVPRLQKLLMVLFVLNLPLFVFILYKIPGMTIKLF